MNKIILTALGLFTGFLSISQQFNSDYKIDISILNDGDKSFHILKDAYETDEGYVLLDYKGRYFRRWNYDLITLDDDLSLSSKSNLTEALDDPDLIIGSLEKLENDYVLFSQKRFPKDKRIELYAQKVNVASNNLGERITLMSSTYEKKNTLIDYSVNVSGNEKFFSVSISPIEFKRVIFAGFNPFTALDSEFKMFNSDLEEIWTDKDIGALEDGYDIQIEGKKLSDNGDLYLLMSKRESKKFKRDKEEYETEYFLKKVNEDDSEVIEDFDFGNKSIQNISLVRSDDNNIYIGGYYSTENSTGIEGSFLFELDTDKESLDRGIWNEFSDEFINADWSERKKEKVEKKLDRKGQDLGFSNLYFKDVVKHEDGTISLVGEKFWITTHTTTDSKGNTRTYTVYHYGNLVVSRTQKDGESTLDKRIYKHHTSPRNYTYFDFDNAFTMIAQGPKSKMLTKDQLESITSRKEKKELSRSSIIYMESIDSDGETKKKFILDAKNPSIKGLAISGSDIGNSKILGEGDEKTMLLPISVGKKDRGIGRIELSN